MTRARLHLAILISLPLICGPAAAQAGSLRGAEPLEALSQAAVDAEVAELFGDEPAPRARYAVDAVMIRFESVYPDGEPTTVTAQLFVPRVARLQALYIFAPGSTGLVEACRPSREHETGIRWGLYRAHALALAGQGFVAVVPDYMGFGDTERVQPYLDPVAEGRALLDSARAARHALAQRQVQNASTLKVFMAGYSQGGHAAFAAADLRRGYAPDVPLAGIVGYGPSTDLEALFREWPIAAPMATYVFSIKYGKERFDPSRILKERWAASLERDVTRQCIGGMQSYYPWSARDLFVPAFADALLAGQLRSRYPQIYAILRENSTGLRGHRVPALILQGSDDVVVDPESQREFARALCRAGSHVRYVPYTGRRHDTRQAGFGEAVAWMQGIAAGRQPPSSCSELAAGR
jgi:acetyl esterase/lipase